MNHVPRVLLSGLEIYFEDDSKIRKVTEGCGCAKVRRETMAAGISMVCEALAVMCFKVTCLPMTALGCADLGREMKKRPF